MLLIFFILFFICFFPTYLFSEEVFLGQTLLFLSFPFLLFLTYITFRNRSNNFIIPPIAILLFIFGSIFLLTIISKVSFMDLGMVINHCRFFGYALVYCLAYNIAYDSNFNLQDLRKALYMIVASLLLFILFHFAAPELAIVKLQTPRLAIDFTGFRIGGPLEWSYIFAFCITPVLIMAIHETIRREGGTLSLVLALLLMGTLLLSQSKSAYLATFCTLLLYLCFSFLNYRSNKLLITLVTLSACALTYTFITFSDQFAHIWGFIDSLESGQSDASTKARLNQISLIALTVENSILMGYPIIYENIENGFAHYLYFYGLIGLTAYLAFIGSFWFDCYYKCRQFFLMQKGKNMGLHLGILAFATVVPIYALSASPTDSHKGAYFFFSLMAFYAGLIDKNTKVSTRSNRS